MIGADRACAGSVLVSAIPRTDASVAATREMLAAAKPPACASLLATDLWSGSTKSYSTSGAAPSATLQPHEAKALKLACHKE